jgi:translation initiation factor 4B
MIKSWADHCSSDEEDSVHDDRVEQELADEAAAQLQVNDAEPVTSDEIVPTDAGDSPPQRVYDFPSQPPFTAFVGNLSYQIKEVSQFTEAVENLAKELLEEPVKVLGGRIAYNRTDPGKHRGFGYVEVETLDQVSLRMDW